MLRRLLGAEMPSWHCKLHLMALEDLQQTIAQRYVELLLVFRDVITASGVWKRLIYLQTCQFMREWLFSGRLF